MVGFRREAFLDAEFVGLINNAMKTNQKDY